MDSKLPNLKLLVLYLEIVKRSTNIFSFRQDMRNLPIDGVVQLPDPDDCMIDSIPYCYFSSLHPSDYQ